MQKHLRDEREKTKNPNNTPDLLRNYGDCIISRLELFDPARINFGAKCGQQGVLFGHIQPFTWGNSSQQAGIMQE